MTIKECYEKMGSDYESICERFGSELLVQKFALKFLKDTTYDRLCRAVDYRDWDMAFRLAHTLKGLAANLSFTYLEQAASVMTEDLRGGKDLSSMTIWESVQLSYADVKRYLEEFKKG